MSKEAALAFIEQTHSDSEIRKEIIALGAGAKIEDVLDVAAVHGYKFSEAELMAAGKEDAEKSGSPAESELNARELEAVAGGTFNITHSRWYITTDTISVVVKK